MFINLSRTDNVLFFFVHPKIEFVCVVVCVCVCVWCVCVCVIDAQIDILGQWTV